MTEALGVNTGSIRARPAVIDTDLHNIVPNVEALRPYLPDHWKEYVTQSAFRGPVDTAYPAKIPTSAIAGSVPPEGGPPGSSLETLRKQVLDPWNVEVGILNCTYAVESIHNPDTAAVMSSAVNDWQIEHWLNKEPRLRASIVVPSTQPEMAAKEIDRVGGHPGFVQVFLPVRSAMLYGNRHWYPIYEAAARHNLVIGLHFGGSPGNPPTASGWPSYYVEEYVGMGHVFEAQIMNIITEGVFDRFPTLKMAMIEGGWAWVPAWMWRMDKEWKGLQREIPWVRMPPSEYIRKHMKFTLQPNDTPNASEFLRIVEQMGTEELIMFSTDYPHWHFDSDEQALSSDLPSGLLRKIRTENARAFYGL